MKQGQRGIKNKMICHINTNWKKIRLVISIWDEVDLEQEILPGITKDIA